MDMEKFRDMFLVEATEQLQKMIDHLLQFDSSAAATDDIDAMFREAHSIKGMAATMECRETARLAHHLEDRLDECRQTGQIGKAEIDHFLAAADLMEGLLEDIRQGRPERSVDDFLAPAAASGERTPDPVRESPKPPTRILNLQLDLDQSVAAPGPRQLVILKFLKDFGTLLESTPSEQELLKGAFSLRLKILLETGYGPAELEGQLGKFDEIRDIGIAEREQEPAGKKASRTQTVRVRTDLLDHLINLTGELITNRYRLQTAARERSWATVDDGVGQLTRLIKNLHHQVLQVRMVALESIVGRLNRTIHDLRRQSGKDVELTFAGMDIELDRAIVEGLVSPLNHMLRNAVDHGLDKAGRIAVNAWRERDLVVLQIADDGRGIDVETIRRTALAQGLISAAQAETLRDYDLYQLICRPGFSTAREVGDLSGRGVGMNVVKTAVEHLGGILLIDSTPGEGTRITLKLPLTLAIIRALLVECAGARLAMPITRVVQTLEVTSAEVQSSGKQLVIAYQDQLLPLLSLRKILKLPKADPGAYISVVITDVLGRRVGLVVDRLLQQQEIFVQTVPQPFNRLPGCSGGSILGDGQIVFLLELQSLLEKRRA